MIYIQNQYVALNLNLGQTRIWLASNVPRSRTSQKMSREDLTRRRRTSIKQKLGVGSSPSGHHPVLNAPVALPGLTKNLPSNSYASNLCVPPHNSTSTSICLAAINNESASPGGMIVCPCVNPIRKEPCVTTFDNARLGASTSKSPLTICRSGAIPRRKSYVSLSVRLPRQRIWPILPGVRSFLNCEKGGKGRKILV